MTASIPLHDSGGIIPYPVRIWQGTAALLSAAEAREAADALLEALDDFNDDKSRELAGKLTGYPFEASQAEKLKMAIAYIDDFMYDEAAELVRSVIPAI